MRDKCKKLETTLGPDTGDLALRVGMHSGPVTAGVLRGKCAELSLSLLLALFSLLSIRCVFALSQVSALVFNYLGIP